MLRVKDQTLKSRLHRGRLILRKQLADFAGGLTMLMGYPLVPWIGVMAAGYAFGPVLRLPPERRRPVLIGTGLALTLGFVALRIEFSEAFF